MLGVIVHAKVKPGLSDQFLALFAELSADVRQNEPGNLLYALGRGAKEDSFVVMETYRDQAAIEAHRVAAHFQRLFPQIVDLLAEPLQLEYVALEHGGAAAVPA